MFDDRSESKTVGLDLKLVCQQNLSVFTPSECQIVDRVILPSDFPDT
ncbi:hypothetical protein [Anabaena sp. CS-542/02]|nr:hypothetical protein [Anabaena sp. CS-542/02]